MALKRSGKFYRKNEKEVMKSLGFNPTPNSGSGWIIKEDGQNDLAICQLKSTDANSIKINLQDLHTLEYNSIVAHKIPVFAIQFLKTNEVFLVIKPENLSDVSEAIKGNSHINIYESGLELIEEDLEGSERKIIKSSDSARHDLRKEINSKYIKERRSAK